MNNEDFVTYEIAQALKEVGFDWACHHYYTKENAKDKNVWFTFTLGASEDFNRENKIRRSLGICSAPTLAQAQKWLRETHNIHVLPKLESVNRPQYVCHITQLRKSSERLTDDARYFDTYESALSAGIEAALKLIEEGEV